MTTSAFEKACVTSINDPPISLMKSIFYPAVKSILKISSIDYGVKHEAQARAAYTKFMKKSEIHKKFSIEKLVSSFPNIVLSLELHLMVL